MNPFMLGLLVLMFVILMAIMFSLSVMTEQVLNIAKDMRAMRKRAEPELPDYEPVKKTMRRVNVILTVTVIVALVLLFVLGGNPLK